MKKLILIAVYALIASGASSQSLAYVAKVQDEQMITNTEANEMKVSQPAAQSLGCNDIQDCIKEVQQQVAGNERYITSLLKELMSDNEKSAGASSEATKNMEQNIVLLQKYNTELKKDLQKFFQYIVVKSSYNP